MLCAQSEELSTVTPMSSSMVCSSAQAKLDPILSVQAKLDPSSMARLSAQAKLDPSSMVPVKLDPSNPPNLPPASYEQYILSASNRAMKSARVNLALALFWVIQDPRDPWVRVGSDFKASDLKFGDDSSATKRRDHSLVLNKAMLKSEDGVATWHDMDKARHCVLEATRMADIFLSDVASLLCCESLRPLTMPEKAVKTLVRVLERVIPYIVDTNCRQAVHYHFCIEESSTTIYDATVPLYSIWEVEYGLTDKIKSEAVSFYFSIMEMKPHLGLYLGAVLGPFLNDEERDTYNGSILPKIPSLVDELVLSSADERLRDLCNVIMALRSTDTTQSTADNKLGANECALGKDPPRRAHSLAPEGSDPSMVRIALLRMLQSGVESYVPDAVYLRAENEFQIKSSEFDITLALFHNGLIKWIVHDSEIMRQSWKSLGDIMTKFHSTPNLKVACSLYYAVSHPVNRFARR